MTLPTNWSASSVEADFQTGAAIVNEFCQERNYTSTHLGREFLASDPTDDNYTSASDCCRLLSDIYNSSLVNAEASAEMLALLTSQTKTAKIPAGVPSGTATANKTGELADSGKLGVVENDIAIVFDKEHPYVLCVLSNNIKNNSSAQNTIKKSLQMCITTWPISKISAQIYKALHTFSMESFSFSIQLMS